jgi:immunity protein 35 of polymorphic toxin system
MDLPHARAVAEWALDTWVRGPEVDVVVDDTRTRDYPGHWVFLYDTRAYLATRDPDQRLVGNVPLVVDKVTGNPWFARPLVPLEEQLNPPAPG